MTTVWPVSRTLLRSRASTSAPARASGVAGGAAPAGRVGRGGAGAGVEVAGGLVGEDDVGAGQQRPGDRHPLLLAAGELRRAAPQPLARGERAGPGVAPRRAR